MMSCAQPEFLMRGFGFPGMVSWGCFQGWVASVYRDPSREPCYTPRCCVILLGESSCPLWLCPWAMGPLTCSIAWRAHKH